MTIVDRLFTGTPTLGIPPLAWETGRKMPGDQDGDGKGDEC